MAFVADFGIAETPPIGTTQTNSAPSNLQSAACLRNLHMTDHGPWRILASREVYRDPWITVRCDQVLRPSGTPGTHSVVHLKPGVCVLALDAAGVVHLTEEFHYGVGRVTLEAVSGGVEADEAPRAAGQRELQEELGLAAARWTPLGTVDPFTASVVSPTALYLAEELTEVPAAPEETERILRVSMTLVEALGRMEAGEITHAPTCVLLLRAERRGRR